MKTIVSLIFSALLSISAIASTPGASIVRRVNPFIGTGGHGHTFPGATRPFGMVQLSPDTRVEGWDACSGYHYSDSTILGFSHTHLDGTGIADYGDILVVPFLGDMVNTKGDHALRFNHNDESASPGYYRVRFAGAGITAEMTTTERVGIHRYTFSSSDAHFRPGLLFDLVHGLGPDRVVESSLEQINDHEIAGMRRSAGWAPDQQLFFVASFSVPIASFSLVENDSLREGSVLSGTNVKAILRFKRAAGKPVIVKVALSPVDREGALRNLKAEASGWDFDRYRARAAAAWDHELGKISIAGGTDDQQTTFYTALYHSMMAPNIASDIDGRYRGMDKEIHTAANFTMYSVFSLWDTFRGEHPLMTIIDRKRSLDLIRSLLAKFDEQKMLPIWELASNETWCMIGYHAVPVILDAYAKGITGFDASHALEAMKVSANRFPPSNAAYRESGYLPADVEGESVSRTLEYAYDDWCIARMAERLDRTADVAEYDERGQFYKNIFDPVTGFMRPRVNGAWDGSFDPAAVTAHFTEANSWQYSFFVPQDVPGLVGLHGGPGRFVDKLDSLFFGSSRLTGREQADITGLIGKYAQGNEPSQHIAYLYNEVSQPWKTELIVRRILDSLYTAAPDGLCGNDDCGQMSAWYVLNAIGMYPVTPGLPQYSIGSPLFEEAAIHLENGKTFTIRARNASKANKYIQSARLNGASFSTTMLNHAAVAAGGSLDFTMGSEPSADWGVTPVREYHSTFSQPITIVPLVDTPVRTFSDSLAVPLRAGEAGAEIYYTVDGSAPTAHSTKYSVPILLHDAATIRAMSVREGVLPSRVVTSVFHKTEWKGAITLNSVYAQQYSGGGNRALIDGLRGGEDFRLGAWQGYEQTDLDAVVDLGAAKQLDSVALGCLQDNNSWIFFPTDVQFSFSADSVRFSAPVVAANAISPQDPRLMIRDFGVPVPAVPVRYIHVHAKSIGVCPPWHKGAGGKAWLFADEVVVKVKK